MSPVNLSFGAALAIGAGFQNLVCLKGYKRPECPFTLAPKKKLLI